MVKCPHCSKDLVFKNEPKKICAQIGNPDIAIVEVDESHFCSGCNEYFLKKEELASAIMQIKEAGDTKNKIEVGVYS